MKRLPVAVVGAGLAGSVAAWRLAQGGLPVAFFEREQEPGTGAACGGVMLHSLGERLQIGEVAEGAVDTVRIEGIRRPFTLRFPRPIFVSFHRGTLDRTIALRAAAAGADLRTGCTVSEWRPDTHELLWRNSHGTRSQRFAAVVFADGPLTAARSLGIGTGADAPLGGAFYRELEDDVGTGRRWTAFSLGMPADDPGYYWVFPKKGHLQVGVGRLHGERRPPLRRLLDRFIEADPTLSGRRVVGSRGGIIPFRPARAFAHHAAMVAGDAAGLVNPLTGGGLVYAAASGELAADSLLEAARRGEDGQWAADRYASRLERSVHLLWLRALQIPFTSQLRRLHSGQRPYFLPLFLLYVRVLPRLTPAADAITLRRAPERPR